MSSPFGTTAGITESDAIDVVNWRGCAYGGNNVVIVGTGNVNHDELCAAAEQLEPEVKIEAKFRHSGVHFGLPKTGGMGACTRQGL